MTRDEAWALLCEHTKGDSLRKHARAVVRVDEVEKRATDGNHRVDCLQACLHGLAHGLAVNHAGSDALDGKEALGGDRTLVVDRTTERVDVGRPARSARTRDIASVRAASWLR